MSDVDQSLKISSAEKEAEEQKRDRNWDAGERWKALQRFIAWADSQQPIPRNSKAGALAAQEKILQHEIYQTQRSG